MHKFIQQVQERSLPHKLRVKVQEATAKAIENLINSADEIPGVGKLVAKIDIDGDEVSVQLGVKRPEVSTPEVSKTVPITEILEALKDYTVMMGMSPEAAESFMEKWKNVKVYPAEP